MPYDEYTLCHSVNVALISVGIGPALGYSASDAEGGA